MQYGQYGSACQDMFSNLAVSQAYIDLSDAEIISVRLAGKAPRHRCVYIPCCWQTNHPGLSTPCDFVPGMRVLFVLFCRREGQE